jgi:glycosyltransferase involved in cell wall biosynthesis
MKKVIYFVSEDWVFLNHRIELAKKIQKKGYKVILVTNTTHYKNLIEKEKIKVIPLKIERGSLNIRKSIKIIYKLSKIFKDIKPDIVHNFGLRQIVHGNISAQFAGVKKKFNSIIGLGSIFISGNFFLRFFITNLLRFTLFLKNSQILVQNKDDYIFFKKKIWIREKNLHFNTTSGINLNKYKVSEEPRGKITFLFASRILKDKGVMELIKASKKLNKITKNFELFIAGTIDSHNPSSISHEEIKSWEAFNYLKYMGHVNDMNELYKKVHVGILPSYREGLPKSLLEAAACGKPIITTNVTGCRDIVIDGKNGILVNMKDSDELFLAMKKMVQNKKIRLAMGKEGRNFIKKNFLIENTVKNLIHLYKNC